MCFRISRGEFEDMLLRLWGNLHLSVYIKHRNYGGMISRTDFARSKILLDIRKYGINSKITGHRFTIYSQSNITFFAKN